MLKNELLIFLPYSIIITTIILLIFHISIVRHYKLSFVTSSLGILTSLIASQYTNNYSTLKLFNLFTINSYNIFVNEIILMTAIIICFLSYSYIECTNANKEEFYVLLLLSTLGCLTLNISSNFISMFTAIELISLPFCGLISFNLTKKLYLESSWKYIIISTLSSTILLLGITLIYSIVGTFSFEEIQKMINFNSELEKIVVLIGLFFVILSFCLKLSIFPFYFLTPDMYESLPTPTLMYYSTIFKTSILFIFIKIFLLIPNIQSNLLIEFLKVMSFFSILLGNCMAIFQKKFKRLLGYSSISHFGYLLIPIIFLKSNSDELAIKTIFIYFLTYILNNLLIFGSICYIESKEKKAIASSFQGLFWKYPISAIFITLSIVSFSGIPFTIGFLSKSLILFIAITHHSWILILGILLGTTISFFYYIQLINNIYKKNKKNILNLENKK